jgi:hypothetical protein
MRSRVEHRIKEMREIGAPALGGPSRRPGIGMTIEEILQCGKSAVAAMVNTSRTSSLKKKARAAMHAAPTERELGKRSVV